MPPPTLIATDDALSERLEPRQLAEIARLHGESAFKAAYRVLGNTAMAEDIQQDVFLRLAETPVNAVESWPAWLSTAATRLAIDRLRRRARWQRLLPMFSLQEEAQQPVGPERAASREQGAQWLRSALSRLPRLQAQCFALRHFDELDNGAIAQALGISINYVGVNLHRAAERLRKQCTGVNNPSSETSA